VDGALSWRIEAEGAGSRLFREAQRLRPGGPHVTSTRRAHGARLGQDPAAPGPQGSRDAVLGTQYASTDEGPCGGRSRWVHGQLREDVADVLLTAVRSPTDQSRDTGVRAARPSGTRTSRSRRVSVRIGSSALAADHQLSSQPRDPARSAGSTTWLQGVQERRHLADPFLEQVAAPARAVAEQVARVSCPRHGRQHEEPAGPAPVYLLDRRQAIGPRR